MKYTINVAQGLYQSIREYILRDVAVEHAGFAFAKLSQTAKEQKLILREFYPIDECHVLHADETSMVIDSTALVHALKYANNSKQSLVFIHSHPSHCDVFSVADDASERFMFRSAFVRIDNIVHHASIVFPHNSDPFARCWFPDGQYVDIDRIRVIGPQFLFFDRNRNRSTPEFFDRQVRAFGHDIQSLLSSLHIAVVGVGGTGSASIEQLIRLGIGKISIYDCQTLEKSNVSRVFGSRVNETGKLKVEILSDWAKEIGLGTEIIPYAANITDENIAKTLRDADIIFGCTDDQWGRSILNDLAIRYLIPVIDMGVQISSSEGIIRSVCGRVTVLIPGAACLFCRQRISPEEIKAESDYARRPEEAIALGREGYAPELRDEEHDPSVIPFTSSIASLAVTELLQRLTGFMGAERKSTEVICFFDRNEIHTNASSPASDCKCMQSTLMGVGDTRDFLGLLWA